MSYYDIVKNKRLKLKEIIFNKREEGNIFRSKFLYDFGKFRKKKWKMLRNKFYKDDKFIFRRFAPNLSYIPNYSNIIHKGFLRGDISIKINKFSQLLTYSSRLFLRRRVSGFYLMDKVKDLKKMFVYRHITTHFNMFDSNYEVILLRLGLVKSIKEARLFIKDGILKVNKHIVKNTRHLIHNDFIEFSKVYFKFKLRYSSFNFKKKKYGLIEKFFYNSFKQYILLILEDENIDDFLGVLPFTSTFNFSNFTFIYFNYLMKNQWHFFWDFFIIKKFLKYNR